MLCDTGYCHTMTVQPESISQHVAPITTGARAVMYLVAVRVRLVRALDLDADVLCLLRGQGGELGAELAQVQAGDLLVKDLHASQSHNSVSTVLARQVTPRKHQRQARVLGQRSVQGTPG